MKTILIGPSGSGKTTIAKELEKKGFKVAKSMTTRPKRNNENEDSYFFVDETAFEKEELILKTDFNGYQYGLPVKEIERADVFILEPSGAKELRRFCPEAKIIALAISKSEARKRMVLRGDTAIAIRKRMENDEKVFTGYLEEADYIVPVEMPIKDILSILSVYLSL